MWQEVSFNRCCCPRITDITLTTIKIKSANFRSRSRRPANGEREKVRGNYSEILITLRHSSPSANRSGDRFSHGRASSFFFFLFFSFSANRVKGRYLFARLLWV
ncbi:hypothetical protein PUN28_008596 [Cardiocondyla obscurior]|uniref:Uncharacterized protein n=1 Tax=Cardiocondyla obscurior TaxID=286306 RepID=A0AAW2G095_9HYME